MCELLEAPSQSLRCGRISDLLVPLGAAEPARAR